LAIRDGKLCASVPVNFARDKSSNQIDVPAFEMSLVIKKVPFSQLQRHYLH